MCQPYGCRSKQIVLRTVYVNLNITVPQNCVINAGQVVNIDFGNISSGAFKTAGARAEDVNPVTKTIGIQCNNIAAQANLTLRVQADNVSGNAIVSNNRDVGFVVTDGNNRELTPNNLSSVIPFTLDSSAQANVTIRVYPVSVTGNKPTEGVVTSLAYLRVDFARGGPVCHCNMMILSPLPGEAVGGGGCCVRGWCCRPASPAVPPVPTSAKSTCA
ncbi:fimbrial protein [Klebsiella michiganensis]|nr:fimbrial protein [Klebsiella michiganensis]MDL4455014.1 fimbrial protein [Klebsiella michiganensis]